MKTLAWVLVILNQSEVITDGELLYPSLQKCEMYEKKVNRPLQKICAKEFPISWKELFNA